MTAATAAEAQVYKQYKRRFLYAIVVIVINLSNAMTWISFAPISYHTNAYYQTDLAAVLLNVVFMALSIPVGLVAVWLIDRFGLRGGIYIGGLLNFIGNALRLIADFDFVPASARFAIAMTGQSLAAISQPFIMYLPTKLTGYWFPADERNLWNTLTSMSNPIGIAIMYASSPQIVNNDNPTNFMVLNGICFGMAALSAIGCVTITKSEPPTPVSGSKAVDVETPGFWAGIKKACRSRTFLVLCLCLGGGVGLFNALYNNLQPALCAKGYSETFNGVMGALLIASGLFGAAAAGILADKKKNWTEFIMKGAFVVACIGAGSLTVAVNYEGQEAWIIISIIVFGFAGFALYPLGLETGVEITFPVAEATSTGLIIMSGQIQGVLYVLVTAILNVPASPHERSIQTCSDLMSETASISNWKWSFIAWMVFVAVLGLICIIFFRPKLRRMALDVGANARAQLKEDEEESEFKM
ncbi:hypothetical protein PRIPAC_95572 [Pristionchus pacificus]|uniref:Membrane transporter n=1 Tax=Pristionchus pacificus TaxID=54126 RepID=A0A2A6BCY6_PRIPA|nr:hypothetical protein PRIPAC_95572 [Pristionchus pacificus]|eukprot:PDM63760.1 membrane transporter [Pristionchus pacificus]